MFAVRIRGRKHDDHNDVEKTHGMARDSNAVGQGVDSNPLGVVIMLEWHLVQVIFRCTFQNDTVSVK